jgi:DNA modification methylase
MGISLNISGTRIKKYDFRNLMKGIIPKIDYLTHCIHPYTAKLIPHIPRYFIEKYTQKNDIVLDPFCGSGTTLLEARLSSRNAIGIDINPLAVLIAEVKTIPLNIDKLSLAVHSVKEKVKNENCKMYVEFPNISYWFCKEAQEQLCRIRYILENLNGEFDENLYKFLLVCFSAIIRKSSYADPRIAKTFRSKRVKEKIKAGWIPTPIQYFEETLDRNFERMKSLWENVNLGNNYVKVFQGDARETQKILTQYGFKKVDFIITSPPYINAQDYFRSYKFELWWLGLATPQEVRKLDKQAIGTENIAWNNCNFMPKADIPVLNAIIKKIWYINKKKSYIVYSYFENMKKIFEELYNVLKTNGYFCLITGCNTICGVQIPTYEILIQIAEKNGFKLIEVGRDEIKNRALPPNRSHNSGIIKEEWITIFQKSDET